MHRSDSEFLSWICDFPSSIYSYPKWSEKLWHVISTFDFTMRCNAYSWCLSWKQAKKFIFWLAAYQSRKSENELYCLLCLSLYLLSGFDQFPITSSYVWPGFQIDLGTFENTCDLWNGAQNNPWGKTATVGGSAAKSWMGCDPSLGSRDIS